MSDLRILLHDDPYREKDSTWHYLIYPFPNKISGVQIDWHHSGLQVDPICDNNVTV